MIPPKFGHAPVRKETVATARDVLQRLPSKIYTLLEDGGASINIAPNIEDNWPGTGDDERPGILDVTLGEEGGRCYGRDVWVYEAAKVRGSHKLKPARSQERMRESMYQLLGHAINDCMGVVTEKEELASLYDKDIEHMPFLARHEYIEERITTADARALGCSEIIGVLISGNDPHLYPIQKVFPRTTTYLKTALLLD